MWANAPHLNASADLELDFIRIPIKSKAKCVEQCHFLFPVWRNDICCWQERVRKEYDWQPAYEIL